MKILPPTRTLLEMAKQHPSDTLRAAVLEHFARASDILRVLPFIEEPRGKCRSGTREEHLKIAGGDLDTDIATLEKYGAGVRFLHDLRKVKALAQTIADAIINGNSLVNPNCFDGLRARTPESQCITVGGPLRISHLHALLGMVDRPTHFIMPATLRSLITAVATDPEIGRYISFGVDEFGQRMTLFAGKPILMSGLNAYNQQIIDFRSKTGGASIYAVRLSPDGVVGLQSDIMDVHDMGETNTTAPVQRTRVEWVMGLMIDNTNASARLRDIQNERVTR